MGSRYSPSKTMDKWGVRKYNKLDGEQQCQWIPLLEKWVLGKRSNDKYVVKEPIRNLGLDASSYQIFVVGSPVFAGEQRTKLLAYCLNWIFQPLRYFQLVCLWASMINTWKISSSPLAIAKCSTLLKTVDLHLQQRSCRIAFPSWVLYQWMNMLPAVDSTNNWRSGNFCSGIEGCQFETGSRCLSAFVGDQLR